VTATDILNATHLGSLVKVTGKVTEIGLSNDVVESIYVKDASGAICRIFIDGYITKDVVIANLKVGADITAIGLSSNDAEGPRVRIRNRADITCTEAVSEPEEPQLKPKKVEITVKGTMSADQLAAVIMKTIENSKFEFPLITLELGDDVNNVTLTSDIIKAIENGVVQLTVAKGSVVYVIPVKGLGLTELTAMLGEGALESDTELSIDANKVDKNTKSVMTELAKAQGIKLLGNPIEFIVSVRSKSNGKTVQLEIIQEYRGKIELKK
jgi:hypothetical protein